MAVKAEPSGRRPQRWFILLLMPLTVVSAFLHVSRSSRSAEVLLAREQYSALVRERPIEATKARRARFYQLRYFLAYPAMISHAAADLIRRLHHIAPPLRLLAIQVDPALHELGFELTVGVEGTSPGAARREFAVFFGKLEMLAGVTEASFSPGEGNGRRHGFVVRGRMELP